MASIKSKQQLEFYLKADRMMNRGAFKYSFKQKLMYYLLRTTLCNILRLLGNTHIMQMGEFFIASILQN